MSTSKDVGNGVNKLFRVLNDEELGKVDTVEDWVVTPDGEEAAKVLTVGPFSFDPEKFVRLASPHPMTEKLTAEEKAILKDSIAARGITDDVIIAPSGRIVDGFHRVLVACELLMEGKIVVIVPCRVVEFVSDIAEAEYVAIQHVIRRQLDPKKRLRMAEYLLRQGHDGTDGHIATLTGASENTVTTYREKLEAQAEIKILKWRYDIRGAKHRRSDGSRKNKVGDASKRPAKRTNAETPHGLMECESLVNLDFPEPDCAGITTDQQVAEDRSLKVKSEQMSTTEEDLDAPEVSSVEPQPDPAEADSNSETIPADIAPIVQNDLAILLLKKWWDYHGIVPVTCTDLKKSIGGSGIDQRLAEFVSNSTKLGQLIGKLVGHEVGGYFVQERLIAKKNRIYYLRPTRWTIHGPQ